MFYKKIFIILILFSAILLNSCASNKKKSVHGDQPLIKPSDIVVEGRKQMDENYSKYYSRIVHLFQPSDSHKNN